MYYTTILSTFVLEIFSVLIRSLIAILKIVEKNLSTRFTLYINWHNWWANSEGQRLDTGRSCVFDYTLPLRHRQAEMFKLSGNQTAERRETQTRDGRAEGWLGTKMRGERKRGSRQRFFNKCQAGRGNARIYLYLFQHFWQQPIQEN